MENLCQYPHLEPDILPDRPERGLIPYDIVPDRAVGPDHQNRQVQVPFQGCCEVTRSGQPHLVIEIHGNDRVETQPLEQPQALVQRAQVRQAHTGLDHGTGRSCESDRHRRTSVRAVRRA